MPYTPEHKQETRARIVEAARQLFNRHGFTEVSIDDIMAAVGLTRGGFYNHFNTKEELYGESLLSFMSRKTPKGSAKSTVDFSQTGPELARQMVVGYISRHHLSEIDEQCPLIALPSDVARAGPVVRETYRNVLEAMAGLFVKNAPETDGLTARQRGLAITATCVGAMVLARTIDDNDLADEFCDAARRAIFASTGWDESDGTSPCRP